MEISDLVKITTYLRNAQDVSGAADARARFLGDARPASFTGIIEGFVKPDWLIEIEAVAAQSA